ncbi:hypothetical protein JOF46_000520 [Paeniglutamicibacter psychrophenolicus]|uniref:Uncharacterized protein n=1 Tax=Paeniglutamicibacter psychrophenolicus TaxID=257454 RepID=A0ABS4W9L1_9MICC|nr:hypothetical protein [Paeniglutamicibacter psychrophenolicus]
MPRKHRPARLLRRIGVMVNGDSRARSEWSWVHVYDCTHTRHKGALWRHGETEHEERVRKLRSLAAVDGPANTSLESRRVPHRTWRRRTKYAVSRTGGGATTSPVAAPAGGGRNHRDCMPSLWWWRSIAHSQPGGEQGTKGVCSVEWLRSSLPDRSVGAMGQGASPSTHGHRQGEVWMLERARIGSGRISGKCSLVFVGNHCCLARDPGLALSKQGRRRE